jgi:hypothetical protein
MRLIEVTVTDKGAVYVGRPNAGHSTRITGRDSKWGVHTTVFEAIVPPKQVVQVLKDNGYGHIKLDAEYAAEFKIVV